MIPRRLRLTNFLSHEDSDVDFTDLHAAVLTGHNGAGKSSLLDAITWALWGQARAAGDQVVRIGEAECAVELVVEVAGVEYTIRRRRSTHKSVPTSLEFFTAGRPLTLGGVRETQTAITAAMGVDYETFISSSFLAQGKADVFTASTPKARKELLGDVLGLGRYDVLTAAARDAAKAQATQIAVHGATVQRLEASVGDIEDGRRHLAVAEESIKITEAAREQAEQDHEKLIALTAKVKGWAVEYKRHQDARAEAEFAEIGSRKAIAVAHEALAAQEDKAFGHEAARERHDAWQALTIEEAAARGRAEEWVRLDRAAGDARAEGLARVAALNAEIVAANAARRAQRDEKTRALAVLEGGLAEAPRLEASRATATARLAEFEDVTAAFETTKEQGIVLDRQRAEVEVRQAAFERAATDGETKLRELAARLAAAAEDAPCPTCARPLTEEALAAVREQMEAAIGAARAGGQAAAAEAAALVAELALKREECERLRDKLRARAELQAQISTLDGQLLILARDREAATARAAEIAALNLPDPRVEELRQAVALAEGDVEIGPGALLAQRDALGHDPVAYAALREQLAGLADVPAAWAAAQAALLDVERCKAEVARLTAEIAGHVEAQRRAKDAADAVAQEAMTRDFANLIPALEADLVKSAAEIARLRAAEREADQHINALAAGIARMEAAQRDLAAARVALQNATDAEADYKALALAFGRNGIQAHALESAIPEIEEEANRLLADLGDNRTHVQLVTQRDLKGGGVAETLDVRIADDAGERPYESYSGGEAFRVNFALRLALARLLARRRGAPLQLLVIDEGFGTQDEAGRTRLLHAINAVAPSFALILIVTHIRELVDAFNQRIDVAKVGGVSRVKVAA